MLVKIVSVHLQAPGVYVRKQFCLEQRRNFNVVPATRKQMSNKIHILINI